MTAREAKRLLKRIALKPDWIGSALDLLEKFVKSKQHEFAQEFLSALIDQLETEEGKIIYSQKNKKLLARIDTIQSSIRSNVFNPVIQRMISNFQHVVSENIVYYGKVVQDQKLVKVTSDHVRDIVYNRLGLNTDGKLIRNGYMQGLLDAPEVTTKLKDYVFRSVSTKSGFENFKTGLRTLIEGDPDKLGSFERFYRNYAYDTYSQVDSMQSKLLAEDFKLVHFIYNGPRVKASRAFCLRKKGRVFHVDDTKKWEEEPDNTAKPPNYDPLIHRGGYGCIDSIDYISEEMAAALGYGKEPDTYKTFGIKQFANGGEIITSDLVDVNLPDYARVYNAAQAFARMGHKVEIKPKMKNFENPLYKEVYADLIGTPYERKNPDLYIDGKPYEHEGYVTNNPKRALQNMLNGGVKQSSRIIIDEVSLTDHYIKRNINNRVINEGQEIEEVWVLSGKDIRLLYKR
ncbi:hypothetical protein FAZ19_16240 [Sphingobacterium alkalisoli]|uniref:tRNA nuclease CdiA C-terminal domain-containing protein n=1 Tax=Sphingobacterium alkalisoli TaxID=1874115 RepID=A0A4U0GXQ3_9SPHI|nr:hypothetical protein [Sphingobacterium alkalisoli]TJY63816.1 hypothetical protein FAZ19_16240 [Sphingobacterium alkalisoli]GGH24701.1 hypothetical protein GCM10011418_32790 [Sphingobacterium alkalisoli]